MSAPSPPSDRRAPRRRAPARPATPSPTPLRGAAAAVLGRVLGEKLFFDLAWTRERERLQALTPGDRIAARRIALTALRRLGEIDDEIDRRLAKPLPKKAAPIRDILRVAAAETAFLGGPSHAAVDAAVRLAKRVDGRLSGLVNAVARRLAEAGPRLADRSRLEAGKINAPRWLWTRLAADWGEEDAARIAAAHLASAPLDLTLRDPGDDAARRWAETLGAETTPTGLRLRAAEAALTDLPGFAEGAWWVQDAAAALPARLLGPVNGLRVLDLCAAPGGKTLQLAAAGAETTALDQSETRLERLRENLARTGLEARIVAADALSWRPETGFDAVLLDAPCSASGTIRRHPELPWIKDGAGLEELAGTQDAMLNAAWRMLRPGGRLVFCTCSLFKQEGESRAAAFLDRHSDACAVAAKGLTPPETQDAQGRFRTKPFFWGEGGGMDGFFAAAFAKRAS